MLTEPAWPISDTGKFSFEVQQSLKRDYPMDHTPWTLSNIVLYSLLLTVLTTVIMCACLIVYCRSFIVVIMLLLLLLHVLLIT